MSEFAISFLPEKIFHLGPLSITNSIISSIAITFAFGLGAFLISRRFSIVPGKGQLVLEMLSEFVMVQLVSAFGTRERAQKFFPLLMSLLLFIAIANQFTLIPLVGQMVLGEKTLFRLPTADLNQTMALALAVVGVSHILALSVSPLGHIGNFIKIKQFFSVRSGADLGHAFLEFFLGLLDIIGEIAKVLSLSFRLFGNIFAGDVMVIVIAGLSFATTYIVPIPFIFLSLFSGFVQAFVFFMLSTQFIAATIGSYGVEESTGAEGGLEALEGAQVL